jgi:uncharacterized protein YjiS (DUF1127 family)
MINPVGPQFRAKGVIGDWTCSTVTEERRVPTPCTPRGRIESEAGMIADVMRGASARLQQMTGRAAGGLLRFGRTLAKRVLRAHRRRVALRELESLDDRMLKDIGLSRGSIPYEMERALTGIGGARTSLMRSTREASSGDGVIALARGQEIFRRAA